MEYTNIPSETPSPYNFPSNDDDGVETGEKTTVHPDDDGAYLRLDPGYSFSNKRWGEEPYDTRSKHDNNVYIRYMWIYFRNALISIGIGCVEFVPVISLAWLYNTKLYLLEKYYEDEGIGVMLAVNLAYAVV